MAQTDKLEDEVRKAWEAFLMVDTLRRAEKMSALDAFLVKFLSSGKDSHRGTSGFKDMDGVSSVVTRHFLADIHEICVSSEGEDTKLMEYLVTRRGGNILRVLNQTGVHGITCNVELANQLLSFVAAFCSYATDQSMVTYLTDGLKKRVNVSSSLDVKFPALRFIGSRAKDNVRSSRLRNEAAAVSFEALVSSSEGNEDEAIDGKVIFDLVVSLIEQLCINDVRCTPTPTVASTILSVISDLIQNLVIHCQSESEHVRTVTYVSKKLVELAVSDAIVLGRCPSGHDVLVKSGLFAAIFTLVGNRLDTVSNVVEDVSPSVAQYLLQDALNCILGCISVLSICTESCIPEMNYNKLVDVYDSYIECEGSKLTANCLVLSLCQLEGDEHISQAVWDAVWALGDLGASIRRTRVATHHSQLNGKNCVRKWKRRIVTANHHHSLITQGGRNSVDSNRCPLASICGALLTLTSTSGVSDPIAACVLSALNRCGTCCCVDFRKLFFGIFAGLSTQSAPLRELSLRFLETSTVMSTSYKTCFDCVVAICAPCKSRIDDCRNALDVGLRLAKYSSKMEQFSEWLCNLTWSVFDPYVDLLLSANHDLLEPLERHLLAVITGVNDRTRLTLFVSVFLRLLHVLSEKEATAMERDDLVRFCLNCIVKLLYLPGAYNLLRAGCKAAELCQLLGSPNLRQSVLELLRMVMLEETKVICSFENVGLVSMKLVAPEESVLRLYQEILLKHTVHLKDTLLDSDCSDSDVRKESGQMMSCPRLDGNLNSDELKNLLECLSELWQSVCFILDRSELYRRHFWSDLAQNVVSSTLMALLRVGNNEGSCLQSKWVLFGCMLHIAIICATKEMGLESGSDKWLSNIGPQLEAKLCVEDPNTCCQILSSLITASLATDVTSSYKPSQLRRSSSQNESPQSRADEDVEATDLADSSVLHSTTSSSASSEHGYEADGEEDDLYNMKIRSSTSSSIATVPRKLNHTIENTPSVLCPSVLQLVMNLASSYKRTFLDGSECATQMDGGESCAKNLTILFRRLVSIGKHSKEDGATLQRVGVLGLILKEFSNILKAVNSILLDMKESLLELFVVCARHTISAAELRSFLLLLVDSGVPHSRIFDSLIELCDTVPLQPSNYIQFLPFGDKREHVIRSTEESVSTISTRSSQWSGRSSRSRRQRADVADVANRARLHIIDTRTNHVANALNSSWAMASVAGSFPSPDDKPLYLGGLTISLWLAVDSWRQGRNGQSSPFDKIHLISCGAENLSLEFWLQYETGSLLTKLVTSTRESYNVLDEKTSTLPVAIFDGPHRWRHVTIGWSATRSLDGKRLEVNTQLIVLPSSMAETPTTSLLECQWQDVWNNPQRWFLMLGHCNENSPVNDVSWSVGTVMVFRGTFSDVHLVKTLFALGPDALQLDFIDSYSIEDLQLYKAAYFDELRSKRLLSFLSQKHDVFVWYPPSSRTSGAVFAIPSYPPFVLGCSNTFERCVRHIPAIVFGQMEAKRNPSLTVALSRLGCAQMTIFLFGFVVELCSDEEVQSRCLSLLAILTKKDRRFRSQFLRMSGWSLVMKLISRPQCKASLKTLQSLLSACTSEDVLQYNRFEGQWRVNRTTLAIVTNSALLALLCSNYRVWSKENCLGKLLHVVESLVHDQHPRRDYNMNIMITFGIVDILLTMYRERSFEECDPFTSGVSYSVVRILKVFVTDFVSVAKLLQLLVALHPSKHVYVCQARSSFYFLPIDSYSSVEQQKIKPLSESKSSTPDALTKRTIKLKLESENGDGDFSEDHSSSQNSEGSLPECDRGLARVFGTIKETVSMSLAEKEIKVAIEDALFCRNDDDVHGIDDDLKELHPPSVDDTRVKEETKLESIETPSDDINVLCHGVFELLFGSSLRKTTLEVIDPEVLVVLALHPNEKFRIVVLKALKTYLTNVTEEQLRWTFVRKHLFYLLANQLFQYGASKEIVEICFGIVMNCGFTFDTDCSKIELHFGVLDFAASPLILAIIPKTASDPLLCQNTVRTLRVLCQRSSVFAKELTSYGIFQSLCLTLSTVVHSKISSDVVYDDYISLVDDIQSLTTELATYFVSLHGASNFKTFTNSLDCFSCYEVFEGERCGYDHLSVLTMRDSHCLCVKSAIQFVQFGLLWIDKPTSSNLKRNDSEKPATMFELRERLRILLAVAIDHLVSAEIISNEIKVSTCERSFVCFVFEILLDGCLAILNKRGSGTKPKWHSSIYPIHDTFRTQLGRLLVFLISPSQPLCEKILALKTILSRERCLDLVHYIVKANAELEGKFSFYLRAIYEEVESSLDVQKRETLLKLRVLLRKTPLDVTVSSTQSKFATTRKALEQHEALFRVLGEAATLVTQQVATIRNDQNKLYLYHLKQQFSEQLHARQSWQKLVEQFTHERAIWHCPNSYPCSWELDETEGPHRVRKRLKRCQLTVKERFLLPENRAKLNNALHKQPLAYLFNGEDTSSDLATIIDQLQNAEKIRSVYTCTIVTPSTESKGETLLGNRCLYFVGSESSSIKTQLTTDQRGIVSHTWLLEDIKEIMKRRFLLQDNAIELFLSNGKTFLVSFSSVHERDSLFDQLMASNLPNLLIESDNLAVQTQLWRDQLITNFEYLTQLNKLAGRSFNDLMQYPVFPFVLSDYVSIVLNLGEIQSFRNLAKPMAVQDSTREQHYINQYNFLQKEQSSDGEFDVMPVFGPYHYGSHYSNSGIVLHFLVRLPPFTSMFLSYQDNNFDIPDRTFHALNTSWRLSSSESTTDVKELIPEFFFLPEFLLNFEGFDFGIRQCGSRVDDVVLPHWCRNEPRLFTLIHRQALESPIVTENLHQWIDLVFGYKQTGKAAVDALNLFHPATYFGFNVEQMSDPLRKLALHTMIKSFGQTPIQLFNNPHPMVSLYLTSQIHATVTKPVMKEVIGLRWGSYVGSPEESEPRIAWQKRQSFPIGCFVPMVTNEVFGLTKNTCLLVQYCKDKGACMINTMYLMSAALVFWGHHDGMIWIQLQQDRSPQPFFAVDVVDPVTSCGSTPDCMLLFLGKTSGIISVHQVAFDQTKPGVKLLGDPIELYGHTDTVLDLYLCKNYSIAVSSSVDCTCIIWDLNKLSYVRSIRDHDEAVHLVKISEVAGDIVSVSDFVDGSCLMLHTINGKQIGCVRTDLPIRSVCLSTAPEGISVNVVCAGMANGSIRMWSSWDLNPVRTIHFEKFTKPITCLAYSLDCQHLYVANARSVIIYESSSSKNTNTLPKFRTLI